jgi:hypothetical protein
MLYITYPTVIPGAGEGTGMFYQSKQERAAMFIFAPPEKSFGDQP